jgi:type VI secretion system protein ImpB
MSSSVHDKLKRVRKPRVHITYEVETEGAVEEKELPFVVGVMGDFSGHPVEKLKSLRDRKFVNIDRDNINEVMQQMKPGLNLRVNNTLQDDGSEMPVQLKFESIDDFDPVNVAKQVKPLRELLEARDRLRDLLTKVDLSEDLESVLTQVLGSTEQLSKLAKELGVSPDADVNEAPPAPADDSEGGE